MSLLWECFNILQPTRDHQSDDKDEKGRTRRLYIWGLLLFEFPLPVGGNNKIFSSRKQRDGCVLCTVPSDSTRQHLITIYREPPPAPGFSQEQHNKKSQVSLHWNSKQDAETPCEVEDSGERDQARRCLQRTKPPEGRDLCCTGLPPNTDIPDSRNWKIS